MMKRAGLILCGAILMAMAAMPGACAREFVPFGNYGAGPQVHRFVLRDPISGAPMPHTRYRLFLAEHDIPGLGALPVLGITDARGRAAPVRLARRFREAAWTLEPVIGAGEFGQSFVLKDESGKPHAKLPYLLDAQGGALFCGESGRDGGTYYILSHRVQTVSIYLADALSAGDYAWCRRVANVVGDLPAQVEPPEVFRTMLALYEAGRKELSEDMQKRIRQKLITLAIESRHEQQYAIAIGLGTTFDEKDMGFDLINANFMVARGMALIEVALKKTPDDPIALDSKGWGLFRLGQSAQALAHFERSIAAFAAEGGDTLNERAVGLVHKGEVLWTLGRKTEARQAFAAAADLAADDATLAATLLRLGIDRDAGQ